MTVQTPFAYVLTPVVNSPPKSVAAPFVFVFFSSKLSRSFFSFYFKGDDVSYPSALGSVLMRLGVFSGTASESTFLASGLAEIYVFAIS